MKSTVAVIVSLACVLAACDHPTPKAFCTPLMPKAALAFLNYATQPASYPRPPGTAPLSDKDSYYWDSADTWGELGADCLIVRSRQYADKTDEAASVAAAILQACEPTLDILEARVSQQEDDRTHNFAMEDTAVQEIQEAEKKVALRYVIEARSGQCGTDRPETGPWLGGVLPTIAR